MRVSLICIFMVCFSSLKGESRDLEISVFHQLKEVKDYTLLMIVADSCVVNVKGNNLLKEFIKEKESNQRIELLLKFDNITYMVPIYPKDISSKIEFYIDNRWIGNKTKKKFEISRTKFLFKKVCYVLIDRSHSIMLGVRSRKTYSSCD